MALQFVNFGLRLRYRMRFCADVHLCIAANLDNGGALWYNRIMNLNNLRGAIFDLDGTLFDSMQVWAKIDALFFSKRNMPQPPDYQDIIKHLNFPDAARYTKERFALPDSEEEIMREWTTDVTLAYKNEVLLKPYAKELLLFLHERGVKLGVATSSKAELYLPVFERCEIAHLFTAVVTTEQTKPKTFADVYLETARRLCVEPHRCAVFEDIVTGAKSAKAAGFYTVAVQDDASYGDEKELKSVAHEFITSFSELL